MQIKNRCSKQTQQEKIAQSEIDNAQVQSLTRVPEVIMSLKSGKVKGMVIEGPVAEAYLKQNKDLTFAENVKFNEGTKVQQSLLRNILQN